ncbi:sulfotransferase family protein [Paracoccus aminophilus]|uniref:sulfotransferase family protein n=1 Tax=Paracoccus aminophilus TaxID=34003 RepID=UPI00130D5A01|nr:sulfotransferase [Paracoccus aminophilus]
MQSDETAPGAIPEQAPRDCVLVLGMHRSGTSALSGLLHLAGCAQPANVMPPLVENPKGFFESTRIRACNDDILQSAGSAWHDWTAFDPDWTDGPEQADFHDRALETLTEEFGAAPLFVFKDPRICRLVPFWLGVLKSAKCQAHIVHIHRNPLEVAASLQRRNGMSADYGLLLWLRHVLEAEASTRGQSRHFVSYNDILNDPVQVIDATQDALGVTGLRGSAQGVEVFGDFIAAELRHFSEPVGEVTTNPEVSIWVRRSFEILESWAASGEIAADHAELDRIRAEFNQTGPMFAGLVQEGRELGAANKKLASEIEQAQAAALTQQSKIAQQLEAIRALETAAATDQAELATTRAAVIQGQHDLTAAQGTIAAREGELALAQDDLSKVRADVAQAKAALEDAQREISQQRSRLDGQGIALAERFEEISRLTLLLVKSERQREALTKRLAASDLHAADVEAHRNALLLSTSWRVTAPLRRVVTALRGLRRRG